MDTLTQSDINQLQNTYGTTNLKVGDSLVSLVPSYMSLQAGSDQAKGDDSLRDKLVSNGYLMSASDAQGNQGWAAGPAYQQAVDSTYKGQKGAPLPLNQSWAPTSGFGNYQNGVYNPQGFTNRIPIKNAYADVYSDAKSSSWGGVNPVGKVDPNTGVQQYDWSHAVPHYQAGSRLDRMIGPAIGAALGAGMGGLGMFGSNGLGQLGSSLFRSAGNAIQGRGFNPMSLLGLGLGQIPGMNDIGKYLGLANSVPGMLRGNPGSYMNILPWLAKYGSS